VSFWPYGGAIDDELVDRCLNRKIRLQRYQSTINNTMRNGRAEKPGRIQIGAIIA
jgi:hypothetical protein